MTAPGRRLLFMAEGATLAHFGRPLLLAQAMAARGHDVVLAAPERYRRWAPRPLAWRDLETQAPEVFAARLASGRRLYRAGRLASYVAGDLKLIDEVRPDMVIGDFRLSLAASARAAGVPYAAIANAYWSPQRRLHPPAPALGGAGALPGWARKLLFRLAARPMLRWHAREIGEVLAAHGVDIGGDLQRAYTEADVTLYADHPALFPEVRPSEREVFLGPLAWAPEIAPPAWWAELPGGRPVAYLSLGNSGDHAAAPAILAALSAEGYRVIMATAGRSAAATTEGVFTADYLPGALACARADLVVCNGGSPSVNQALAAGRPVLGVCSNLDQFLNMQGVEAAGAGLMLRADVLTPSRLGRAIRRLREPSFATVARGLAGEAAAIDPASALAAAISRLTGERAGPARR